MSDTIASAPGMSRDTEHLLPSVETELSSRAASAMVPESKDVKAPTESKTAKADCFCQVAIKKIGIRMLTSVALDKRGYYGLAAQIAQKDVEYQARSKCGTVGVFYLRSIDCCIKRYTLVWYFARDGQTFVLTQIRGWLMEWLNPDATHREFTRMWDLAAKISKADDPTGCLTYANVKKYMMAAVSNPVDFDIVRQPWQKSGGNLEKFFASFDS